MPFDGTAIEVPLAPSGLPEVAETIDRDAAAAVRHTTATGAEVAGQVPEVPRAVGPAGRPVRPATPLGPKE